MLHRPKELVRRPQFTFAGCVVAVALLQSVSALSMPMAARRLDPLTIAASLSILLVHAALYWFAERVRAAVGLRVYAAAQAALLLAFAVVAKPGPLLLGLLMLLTVEMLMAGGARWGVVPITAAAVAVFVFAELLTGGLYQAASAGVALNTHGSHHPRSARARAPTHSGTGAARGYVVAALLARNRGAARAGRRSAERGDCRPTPHHGAHRQSAPQ